MNFNSKTIGRCLTEYTVINYEELVSSFNKFATVSQFSGDIKSVDKASKVSDRPVCGYGEIMYGVNEDGSLTKLKMIVDSSD